MEGQESELLGNILHASHRSWDVLYIQQGESGQVVQGEPISGSDYPDEQLRQDEQL